MQAFTVGDLMTTNPITVRPYASLREVLQTMKEEAVRQLPVVSVLSGRPTLVGIITNRDVRLAMNSPLVLHDRRQDLSLLESLTAESCMTPDPITISPESPAHLAAEMLRTYKFGALPVVTAHPAGPILVGILTVSDILEQFASDQRRYAADRPHDA